MYIYKQTYVYKNRTLYNTLLQLLGILKSIAYVRFSKKYCLQTLHTSTSRTLHITAPVQNADV